MTEKPKILEYRSSKSASVLPTDGMEQNLGIARGVSCLTYACKTRVNAKTETMMRMKWMLTTFILMGMAALTGTAAYGQADAPAGGQPSKAAPARAQVESVAQTDVGLSGYFAMTNATSGNGTKQTPTNAPGGMLELRHIQNSFVGYEMAFSYNPADQSYAPNGASCGLVCGNPNPPTKITGNAAEVSIDYVVSKKMGNLRPFAVGGLGFFIAVPGATPFGNNTSVRPTYVFGGGVDYGFGSHLGVRVQVRDNMYKAPNTSSIYPATGVFTYSLEPMGGVYYRF
jgi:hypothetical protein